MRKWAEQLRSCRHWTRDQTRDALEKQRASGEGITVLAQRMGFDPERLSWWQAKLRLPNARLDWTEPSFRKMAALAQ